MKVEPGKRFGMLVAVRPSRRANDGHQIWEMLCDCGRSCERQSNNLHARRPSHCGCNNKPNLTHGGRHSREYRQWQGAKARCHRESSKDYRKYGARGIVMCERWRTSFGNFIFDMGNCPAGMSLDRIDNNGPYAPGNCRWATDSQQQRNRRDSYAVVAKGVPFDGMTAAAEHFGVSITTIIRWCEGFFDARRGRYTPKRDDSYRTRLYAE